MVRTIVIGVLIAGAVLLIIFWLLGGGIQRIIGNVGSFSVASILTSTTSPLTSFNLPFTPEVPQIPTDSFGTKSAPSETSVVPNGAQSPYEGDVVLVSAAARTQTASGQYLEISSAPGGASVDIAGWTLQSALSGTLGTIPQAASPFVMGRVNTVGSAILPSGGEAYIVTGASPVGVSFAENKCTGYLGTLQPFVPALTGQCPSPRIEIPDTPENEALLGASCFSYIAQLAACVFPANPPSTLSSACRNEVQTKISYNGCLAAHQADANFTGNTLRMYLAQGKPLWGVAHDVIRLLDTQGRVVSVLSY